MLWPAIIVGMALVSLSAIAHIARSTPRDDAHIGSFDDGRAERRAQRRHAWQILDDLNLGGGNRPILDAWHRAEDIFTASKSQAPHGMMLQSGEPELIIFSFYNEVAYRHIQNHGLNRPAHLDLLRDAARSGSDARSVPSFPANSSVLLTAWWPVAHDGVTALPVWDPEHNPPRASGNSYLTWARVVAVDASSASSAAEESVHFAGRAFANARRTELKSFHYVLVDDRMAQQLTQDARTRKAAVIALGRPLQAGDYLVLVAMHAAAKDLQQWVWATVWWHDQPDRGEFARDRPSELSQRWRNYLLDVAVDEHTPPAADGGPHICFNPWLEARFAQGRQGGGIESNCVACHRRASYPPVDFLPVTRGAPDFAQDPAYGTRQLRTDFLWSLARQAK